MSSVVVVDKWAGRGDMSLSRSMNSSNGAKEAGPTSPGVNAPIAVQHIESWTVDRLTPFVGNARTHSCEQIEQIAASIREFGFVNPLLVGADGIVIESWTVDRLTPFVGNARTHSCEQIEQIAASIREFGFVNPLLVGADGIV